MDTQKKTTTKNDLTSALRTYVQGYLIRNPEVTDDDKVEMALPLRDKVPSAPPVPSVRPQIHASSTGIGGHRVGVLNSVTGKSAKPEAVISIAFASRKRRADEPVSRAADMPSKSQTKALKNFSYEESEYGMVVDYAAAYENSKRERGPWSEVVSLMIHK
jgi:hypothetical protein